MTPEERYQRDPLFHRLVDTLLSQLREATMTGTEIREAAILAAQMHEWTCARTFFIPADSPSLRAHGHCRGCVDPDYSHCRGCVNPDYSHARACPNYVPMDVSAPPGN